MTLLAKLQQQVLELFLESLKLSYGSRCEIAKDLKLWAQKLENPKTTKKGAAR